MITNMFAVQDIKAGVFHPPFPAENKDVAMRFCSQMVAREGHPYNQFPEDYSLFWVGSYDLSTGTLAGGLLEPVCGLVQLRS